jgi:Na+/pantothenate symporter
MSILIFLLLFSVCVPTPFAFPLFTVVCGDSGAGGGISEVSSQAENADSNKKTPMIAHKILNFDFINSLRYNK